MEKKEVATSNECVPTLFNSLDNFSLYPEVASVTFPL